MQRESRERKRGSGEKDSLERLIALKSLLKTTIDKRKN